MELPEQVPGESRLLGVARLGGQVLLFLELALLVVPGRAGEVAEVVLPVGVARRLAVVDLVFVLALGTIVGPVGLALLVLGGLLCSLLQKRIFQELLVHRLHEIEARHLQQLDGLLQLRGHDELLAELQLLA